MSLVLCRVPNLGLLSILLVWTLSSCSQSTSNVVPPESFQPVPADIKNLAADPNDTNALSHLNESPASGAQFIWLKKDFWLNRKIWISLGVERSSVTGLAASVIGYVPAELERSGTNLIVKRQNKGLYGGSTLGPDFTINSYPIVAERDEAILIDFASPKNPYGLSSVGVFDGNSSNEELIPRLEYTKSSETRANSVSFTNVIVAKSPSALFDPDERSAEAMARLDPYTLSATLRTDWITELESPNFTPLKLNGVLGFFANSPIVTNSGTAADIFVSRIDTSKTMNWTISGNAPEIYFEAIKSGVLAWNEALGKDVLAVSMGNADDTRYTNPETSNIVWDDNQAVGMAFANWRKHPYTGEIVQAQVYMSGAMWANQAKLLFKMREIEKQLRALSMRTQGIKLNSAPALMMASGAGAADIPHQVVREATRRLKKIIKEQQVPAERRTERRLVLGWNREYAKFFGDENQFCVRETDDPDELIKNIAALDELSDWLKNLETANDMDMQNSVGSEHEPFPADHLPEEDFAHSESVTMGPRVPVAAYSLTQSTASHSPYPKEGDSVEKFAADVVRSVIIHEVGHTMGLRHNFIGSMEKSLDPNISSASIMDYNDLVVDAQFTRPGTNDLIIMKGVYGSKEDKEKLKTIRFCSDEHAMARYPGCARHDFALNNIDGTRVAEESNLLIAARLLQSGQVELGLGLINQAVMRLLPAVHYINFPTNRGAQFLRDPLFGQKQAQAFQLYLDSKDMLGQAYPAELKSVYAQILAQMLAASVNSRLGESELFTQVVVELKNNALDENGSIDLSTRFQALKGLQNIQDLKARGVLVEIAARLNQKLTQSKSSSDIAQRMEDEEVLTAIGRMLQNGYFRIDK